MAGKNRGHRTNRVAGCTYFSSIDPLGDLWIELIHERLRLGGADFTYAAKRGLT